MSAPKVLISGSGIAGSVFAFCLLRAYPKAHITIVERAPSLRLTGASVDIRSNAVDIIKWAGVEPQIREASTKETGMSFVNTDGRYVSEGDSLISRSMFKLRIGLLAVG
jgi:2-polyprenyl-6-methoxyphenol hydroxylase-like FAD-dependent oxidoreductase